MLRSGPGSLDPGPTLRLAILLSTALLASACGSDPDLLVPFFTDEVVEAAGRNADVTIVGDQECDALLSVVHEEISTVATVELNRRVSYPINPDERILENVPRGRALAIDVVVLNENDAVVGRGCVETTLEPSTTSSVGVEMLGLPICEVPPRFIDVGIVLDASAEMQVANATLGNSVTDELMMFVELMGFPASTKFSLFTHGPAEPVEVVMPTEDREAMKTGFEEYRNLGGGTNRHFAAIELATERLRTRAVCTRRPALLVLSAGVHEGEIGAFENARIGLAGITGDSRDDIYTFGIGVTPGAIVDLEDLIVVNELGEVDGAGTMTGFREALSQARFRFQGLVGP